MRYFIIIMVICTATGAWAQENIPGSQKSQMPEVEKYKATKEYKTKSYTVKEETDVVKKALDVFKKKGKQSSLYKKNIWIYDALEEENGSFLNFTTNDQNAGIVFSPDEEFVYYVELAPGGGRRLKGIKIGTQEEFFVSGVDRFFIETCEDTQASYVVVLDNEKIEGYHLYNLDGQAVVLPDMPADVNDLKKFICY